MSMYGSMKNKEGYYNPTEGIALARAAVGKVGRGEVYWVKIPFYTGSEMCKTRPAVIVSNDERNATRNTVAVVFCSESPQSNVPEHVSITATGSRSTVLCDHIYTIDKSRIGNYIGTCTRREIAAIETGICSALGLDLAEGAEDAAEETQAKAAECAASMGEKTEQEAWADRAELTRLQVERDTYKAMYESLLDRMTMKRRA